MNKKLFRFLARAAILYNFVLLQYLIWVPGLNVSEWPMQSFIAEGMLLLIITPILVGVGFDKE
jgi:hypothetical protein